MIFLAILAFLVIFSFLILVHEWGHFAAARRFGVKVEEFGLGLPPRAKSLLTDKKGTLYSLNWLPLGGFVHMKGEDAHGGKVLREKDSFAAKKVWQRIVIVCAGVFMNFATGFVLLTIIALLGSSYLVPDSEVESFLVKNPQATVSQISAQGLLVSEILSGSPAEVAGLKKYDFISTVDGESVVSSEDFIARLSAQPRQAFTLSVLRRNYAFEVAITTNAEGKIGAGISGEALSSVRLKYAPVQAVIHASEETYRLTLAIADALGGLGSSLLRAEMPADIGGPVAIARETFYRSTDLLALLSFAAMLSITLAFFNILPIPALDGGRLIFLIYEGVTRHRPSPKIESYIHAAGFVILIGFILLVSWHDILNW
jgi:regulator of sigma E protease